MDTLSDERIAELRAVLHIPLSPVIATESLQHEIIELSAHLNAATYRWLVFVGAASAANVQPRRLPFREHARSYKSGAAGWAGAWPTRRCASLGCRRGSCDAPV